MWSPYKEKVRIRETPNLSNDADSSTDIPAAAVIVVVVIKLQKKIKSFFLTIFAFLLGKHSVISRAIGILEYLFFYFIFIFTVLCLVCHLRFFYMRYSFFHRSDMISRDYSLWHALAG